MRRLAAVAAGMALPLLASAGEAPPDRLARGLSLYRRHCASCHGEGGRGDGPGAPLNRPKPRDFSTGQFRLVSSANGVPTDDDLLRTITRGVPGTGMPAWDHMGEEDRRALVSAVRDLSRRGIVERVLRAAEEEGDEADPVEAASIAAARMTPGDPVDAAEPPPATSGAVARGRALFEKGCAACHGSDGRGKRDPEWRTAEGDPIASRDLTAETLKGGDEARDLFRRIKAGIPGSPMPATAGLSDAEAWDVVRYLRSLRTAPLPEAAAATWWLPPSASAEARVIDHDFYLTLAVTATIGAIVLAGLAAALLRGIFRREGTPPWRPGSLKVEAVWIAIPAVIVVVMAANSWIIYRRLSRPIDGALRVHVTGRQFFWAFDLPDHGARSTGALRVPAGRPLHFEIDAEDVIHSFYLPHLKMKRDAVPGITTHWYLSGIDRPGRYPILCNQLCGTDHAIMNATLEVVSPEDFERWVALRKE